MKINDISNSASAFADKIQNSSLLNKSISKKVIISAFVAVVILVAVLSAVIVVKEQKQEVTSAGETTSQESFTAASNEILGNFLFVLTRDGSEDISLIAVIRADSQEKALNFAFLSPDTECSVNGYDGTMQEHLTNGGINELLWAVGEYANISIERYVWGDEENFINWMKSIGDMELEIKEKISYNHNGISFIIDKGLQKLTADNMLKYFVYLCKEPSQKATLIETMLYYAGILFAGQEDISEESINDVIANFTTNISVVDCHEFKNAVRNLALDLSEVKITVVEDLSLLK